MALTRVHEAGNFPPVEIPFDRVGTGLKIPGGEMAGKHRIGDARNPQRAVSTFVRFPLLCKAPGEASSCSRLIQSNYPCRGLWPDESALGRKRSGASTKERAAGAKPNAGLQAHGRR